MSYWCGKVSTGMVTRSALWYGVANPEKLPQTRFKKLPQGPLRLKRGSQNSRLASAYYIPNNALLWKQCHVTTLLSSMSSFCSGRPSETFLYQLFFAGNVVSCTCRGMHRQSINFKWPCKNILPMLVIWLERLNSSSRQLDQWHFSQLMQLWSHACLTSRQVQGTLTVLLQSQIYVTRWHYIHALQGTCYFHQS